MVLKTFDPLEDTLKPFFNSTKLFQLKLIKSNQMIAARYQINLKNFK